jgi:ArsR family transcriptional regulator, arsenate/arsenite/antimonite-responsive transcriptional repressor
MDDMDNLEEIFKALGDPTRIKIVSLLAENGEMCVCKIVEILEMGQPAISHHMAALRHAGLVRHRKAGQWIHYSLNREALRDGPLAFITEIAEAQDAVALSSSCGPC